MTDTQKVDEQSGSLDSIRLPNHISVNLPNTVKREGIPEALFSKELAKGTRIVAEGKDAPLLMAEHLYIVLAGNNRNDVSSGVIKKSACARVSESMPMFKRNGVELLNGPLAVDSDGEGTVEYRVLYRFTAR